MDLVAGGGREFGGERGKLASGEWDLDELRKSAHHWSLASDACVSSVSSEYVHKCTVSEYVY